MPSWSMILQSKSKSSSRAVEVQGWEEDADAAVGVEEDKTVGTIVVKHHSYHHAVSFVIVILVERFKMAGS